MRPHYLRWEKLEERLDLRLEELKAVRENRCCWIFSGQTGGEPVIVKQYKRGAYEGCAREARAIECYAEACRDVPGVLPSRIVSVNVRAGTLCISFIRGELLSTTLRRAPSGRDRSAVLEAMASTGRLLTRLRSGTASPRPPSPFLEEYFLYASTRLAQLPLLGSTLFAEFYRDAEHLFEELKDAGEHSSLSHGDLVLANMIFDGRRIGFIDFAHANFEGHVLDDVYNLWVTFETLWYASQSLRVDLLNALREGVGPLHHDYRAHRFFWEYHRRRWLAIHVGGDFVQRIKFLWALPRLARPQHLPDLVPA